jgi:ApaG protein
MARVPFYYRETGRIRVTVRPSYLPRHSREEQEQYVFAYLVRIENVGKESVQLLSRRWLIHDSVGEETEVQGDGVVGEQPHIGAGRIHEYQSFCVLKSPNGWMEGQYTFVRANGSRFEVDIPRFDLATDGRYRQ